VEDHQDGTDFGAVFSTTKSSAPDQVTPKCGFFDRITTIDTMPLNILQQLTKSVQITLKIAATFFLNLDLAAEPTVDSSKRLLGWLRRLKCQDLMRRFSSIISAPQT
jgi:hypothetical protein